MKWSKWIYISIISVIIVATAVFAAYYYFFLYTTPNFSDTSQNYVSSKTGDPLKPGDDISYSVNYKNSGNRPVDNFEIEIKLPANTSLQASGDGMPMAASNDMITFDIGKLEKDGSGRVEFTVKTSTPLDNGTHIILEDIRFIYTMRDLPNVQIIASGLENSIESSPDLDSFNFEVFDENGGYLLMGDTLEYTFSADNKGDMNATGVEISSILPENISIIGESVNGTGTYTDNVVTWNFESIETGGSVNFKFKAMVAYGLDDGDLIEVFSTLTDVQGDRIKRSASSTVSMFPDLSNSEAFLSDADGGSLWAGETVNVRIVVSNTGEKEAESYRLICPTPANTVYISKSGTPEGISWSDDIRGLIWDLDGLGVGEQKEINFQLTVNNDLYYSGGTISTDFRVETGGQEMAINQASIYVDNYIYMTIVAIGDSLIGKSDWVQRFDQLLEATYPYADYNTIPSAVNGEMSFEGLSRFDSTVSIHRPQIVIIAYGTNDVGASYSYYLSSIEQMVLKAKSLGATVFLNMIGPIYTPGKKKWAPYNKAIIEVANRQGIPAINVTAPLLQSPGKYLFDDGMHYTPAGSALVAQTVYNYVVQYLDSKGGRK